MAEFLCTLHVAQSSSGRVAICYVLLVLFRELHRDVSYPTPPMAISSLQLSSFVDDVIFHIIWDHRAESSTTLCVEEFTRIQVSVPVERQTATVFG